MPLKLHLIKYQHRHENSMQQICREIVQRVGKWIFRKMAKSTLAFSTRCRMDWLKSRKKPCSFQLSHCNQRLATSDLQLATCNLRTADWNLLPTWKTMKGKEKRGGRKQKDMEWTKKQCVSQCRLSKKKTSKNVNQKLLRSNARARGWLLTHGKSHPRGQREDEFE